MEQKTFKISRIDVALLDPVVIHFPRLVELID